MLDIKGLDKAEVLKALYDSSHVQGMGFLQAVPEGTVTVDLCRAGVQKAFLLSLLLLGLKRLEDAVQLLDGQIPKVLHGDDTLDRKRALGNWGSLLYF